MSEKKDKVETDISDTHVVEIEVRKIGNSAGFVLPKEVMAQLGLTTGDKFFVTRAPNGAIHLQRRDPKFEKAMAIARRAMKTYHNTLAELAK